MEIARLVPPQLVVAHVPIPALLAADAIFTGDFIHTPLQAKWPDLAMRIDYDGKQSSQTRWKLLESLCDTNTQCCFAHFPSPSRGYVKRWGDGFKCEYITG